jgi:hypothetical protein
LVPDPEAAGETGASYGLCRDLKNCFICSMKPASELKFPANLRQILEQEEPIWETNEFEPIYITVMEFEHIGQDVIGYQLEFYPHEDAFEPINQLMEARGMDGFGYDWEDLIIAFVRSRDRALADALHGDSEGSTCVLWTQTEEGFRRLLALTQSLLENPSLAKDYLSV